MTNDQFQQMVDAYVHAAEWADKPEGSSARFSKGSRVVAAKDCRKFLDAVGTLADQAIALRGYSACQFGADFWLTRCGHGAGYWDRDELKVDASCNPQLVDRDGKPYNACTDGQACTLGDVLTAAAYGTTNAISPFAYSSLQAIGGWLYFE